MMELFFTLASAVASFATGVAVPATYVGIPYLSGNAAYYVTLLVAWGTIAFGAYVLFNALDATTPQRSWGLYYLSFISSIFAMLGNTITALIVFYQMISGGHLQQLSDITGSLQLLIALTLFSWFDVFYLQRRKLTHLRGRGAPPPASPINGPAEPEHLGAVLAVLAVILIAGAGLMFAIGVNMPSSLAFKGNPPPPVQTQVSPPAPSTTAKGPTTLAAPPVAQAPVTTGWRGDIKRPLGPEWRDVTNR